jgi:hypothetical protein
MKSKSLRKLSDVYQDPTSVEEAFKQMKALAKLGFTDAGFVVLKDNTVLLAQLRLALCNYEFSELAWENDQILLEIQW